MSDTSTATTDAGAATATTAAGTDGTASTATAGTGTATATGTQTQTAPTVEQLQADVEKWKAHSRKNEAALKAKNETDAAQRQLLADVAAKLGIQTADGQPDPAAIRAQVEASQAEAKSARTEALVLRAAGRLGANGDALLDSRAFMTQLEGLDGTEAIEAAIKLAIAQSPARYAAAGGAGTGNAAGNNNGTATTGASASSAGDFTGAAGGNRQWTQEDVNRATPAEVTKAMADGLLKQLLSS